ncbi:MAG: CHRD domain-containing protein [Betaproteobacteria bacterium]|nr:MAG: CHRD domain-containing protein [Betaproteobacteria bacterium]TMH27077.1 MAG: CHRD domain-containing protein [Betaproteobacteria bacterium]
MKTLSMLVAAVALAFATGAYAQEVKLMLSGDAEVPAVKTTAAGSGTITVGADKSVSGWVTTTGVASTAAHIHEAAPGQMNGGVIIPLTKDGDKYTVPAGAKLTDKQYEAFKAGNLYVNVHSAANPGGEIRAQLKP